ncbi:cobalt/nickel transport system permease protein [Thermocatellispora tengchongensis]|uniref:Cobalt/nickel transport system permease protein n=1 Tax=Thermocatellispora tengchongensis TaxID=1073253 RepID=A0A840PRY8_9ACTN|nr:energy-coupling factor ABC transporter permease [Thermocatellispora tengchongensis]MBB5138725.1 cobalt/nickel transport system permease protein [Thermocatellispora tengchongensis]
MHVPDGFFNVAVSVSAGAVAAAGVAVCLRGARRELDDRTAPMAGLVSAFIFAVQMLNFPVALGTSGHLLGGALAAVLVGPYTAVLCLAVVLLVQGFFFADGGLTALGVNITLMGIVTVVVGWAVFRALTRILGGGRGAVVASSAVAALLSVPASALVFTLLFWLGGNAPIEVGAVAAAMGGVHVLIGIGEALITGATVSAVLAVRPDLVYGARGLAGPLLLRAADGTTSEVAPAAAAPARTGAARPGGFLLAGIVVTALLAGIASFYASSSPDGLERVAEDKGFGAVATDHALGEQPLADYGESGGIPVGVAGLIGVGVTLAVGGGLFFAVRRRGRRLAEGARGEERVDA